MNDHVWGEIYFGLPRPAPFTPAVNWNTHVKPVNNTHYDFISDGDAG